MRTFRTLNEIKQYYFPKAYEKERLARISSGEFGKYLAQEIIEGFRTAIIDAFR